MCGFGFVKTRVIEVKAGVSVIDLLTDQAGAAGVNLCARLCFVIGRRFGGLIFTRLRLVARLLGFFVFYNHFQCLH